MRTSIAAVAALAVFASAPGLEAQITMGPTLAWENDVDLGIGVTLRAPLESVGEGVGFLTDFLVFFPSGPAEYLELNANVTYDLPLEGSAVLPFVLAGINIGRVSGEALGAPFDDTEVGLNLGGGVEFDAGDFRPTAGLKVEVGGGEAFIVWITLPFALES